MTLSPDNLETLLVQVDEKNSIESLFNFYTTYTPFIIYFCKVPHTSNYLTIPYVQSLETKRKKIEKEKKRKEKGKEILTYVRF